MLGAGLSVPGTNETPGDAEIEADEVDGLTPRHPARLSAQTGMRATASLRDRQKPDRRTADSPSCRASMQCAARRGQRPDASDGSKTSRWVV